MRVVDIPFGQQCGDVVSVSYLESTVLAPNSKPAQRSEPERVLRFGGRRHSNNGG